MLLWETLTVNRAETSDNDGDRGDLSRRTRRLPFDKRCVALTKSGRRCRGRIRTGSEYCPFHDPAVSAQRRRLNSAKGGRSHRRLSHLPDGYLRKLTNRWSVGNAMDRLYREIRLGVITPDMGRVLFEVLTRLLDSGLLEDRSTRASGSRRGKADRLRPKFKDLLTHAERRAWREAVADAPAKFLQNPGSPPAESGAAAKTIPDSTADSSDTAVRLALTAAS